jgi:hypothetical protein
LVPTPLEDVVRQISAEAAGMLSEIQAASDQMQPAHAQAEAAASAMMARDGAAPVQGGQQPSGEAHEISNRENVDGIINQVLLGTLLAARSELRNSSHNHRSPGG